jgi:trehalose-6-phosphate synthase
MLGYRGARPQDSTILYKDRLVKTGRFTVGIDPQKFDETLAKTEVKDRIRQLKERYKDVKVIVGVDRLDYIKGLVQKLQGFEQLLSDNPDWDGKIVLIQVAVPSREDVKEYQQLETEISCHVGKINGKFSSFHKPNPLSQPRGTFLSANYGEKVDRTMHPSYTSTVPSRSRSWPPCTRLPTCVF